MRVVEQCACGGKIEVYWDGEGRYQREREPEQARKQLVKFFEAFGPTDKLTVMARRKLSSILFS